MKNKRIVLGMSVEIMVLAMSGGNSESADVCLELLKKGGKVDSEASFGGGFNSLSMLDKLEIYEERIHMLYKDVCNCDLGKMIAVLRAYQLGKLAGVDIKTLNHAIDNCGNGIDIEKVVQVVKTRLPKFNPEAVIA